MPGGAEVAADAHSHTFLTRDREVRALRCTLQLVPRTPSPPWIPG